MSSIALGNYALGQARARSPEQRKMTDNVSVVLLRALPNVCDSMIPLEQQRLAAKGAEEIVHCISGCVDREGRLIHGGTKMAVHEVRCS